MTPHRYRQRFARRRCTLLAGLLGCLLGVSGCGPAGDASAAESAARANAPPQDGETITYRLLRKTTPKSFSDVVFELEFAITERNYRITGRNTIGSALRKRGYDDFPDAEVIHFCSLERARTVLEEDLNYLAQMPCRVTVHVENDQTVIHGILLPVDHENPKVVAFAKETNALLTSIVDFVVQPEL